MSQHCIVGFDYYDKKNKYKQHYVHSINYALKKRNILIPKQYEKLLIVQDQQNKCTFLLNLDGSLYEDNEIIQEEEDQKEEINEKDDLIDENDGDDDENDKNNNSEGKENDKNKKRGDTKNNPEGEKNEDKRIKDNEENYNFEGKDKENKNKKEEIKAQEEEPKIKENQQIEVSSTNKKTNKATIIRPTQMKYNICNWVSENKKSVHLTDITKIWYGNDYISNTPKLNNKKAVKKQLAYLFAPINSNLQKRYHKSKYSITAKDKIKQKTIQNVNNNDIKQINDGLPQEEKKKVNYIKGKLYLKPISKKVMMKGRINKAKHSRLL